MPFIDANAVGADLVDPDADDEACPGPSAVVVDLGSADMRGGGRVVWSLPHGGDLDANLVHLDAGAVIGEHVNHEVDVAISVMTGRGHLVVEGATHLLRGDVFALVHRGERREIRAGADGLTYLSIHRRRRLLSISPRPEITSRANG